VDLGTFTLIPVPDAPVPAPGETVILSGYESIPSYGWVATKLDQVKNPALGDNAYEITLNCRSYGASSLGDVEINVQMPSNANVVLHSESGLLYDAETNMLKKTIADMPAGTDYRDVLTITFDEDEDYSIVSSVKIGENPENFTDVLESERRAALPADHINVTDSYIETNEGVTILAGLRRGIPSYTAFVNADKLVGDFKIFTKIADTGGEYDTVIFKIAGQTFTAVYDEATEYWSAVIKGARTYGNNEIVVSTNGNEALAGILLVLFGL